MTMRDIRRVPELGRALREAGIRLPPTLRDLSIEQWIKEAEKRLRQR